MITLPKAQSKLQLRKKMDEEVSRTKGKRTNKFTERRIRA